MSSSSRELDTPFGST
jgi:hypothetical protein